VKATLAAVLGGRELAGRLLPAFVAVTAATMAVLVLD
jgi:uncharacterized membrane protein (DUF4010 family)